MIVEIRDTVAIVVCLIAAGFCFAYVATDQRRKAKKKVHGIAGTMFIIAASIYGLSLSGYTGYVLRSGLLTVGALILIVAVWVMNVLADWRKNT